MFQGDSPPSYGSGYKYFLQYNTLAFERPKVRTWGRQTCFFARTPSNPDTPCLHLTVEHRYLGRYCSKTLTLLKAVSRV